MTTLLHRLVRIQYFSS